MVVLEDMRCKGFTMLDRKKGLDFDHCKAILRWETCHITMYGTHVIINILHGEFNYLNAESEKITFFYNIIYCLCSLNFLEFVDFLNPSVIWTLPFWTRVQSPTLPYAHTLAYIVNLAPLRLALQRYSSICIIHVCSQRSGEIPRTVAVHESRWAGKV